VHHGGVQQELRFQEMLAAAQAGDRESIGDAYQSLQPGLLNYLRAVAGSEAEDIAAQSWLDVVSGVGRFKGDEVAFRRWVFTIARRRVADSQRRWWRRPRSVPFDGFDDVPGNADIAADAVDWQRAIDQLRRLPPELAEIVSCVWSPDSRRRRSGRSRDGRPRPCECSSIGLCTASHVS
jgi:RNA polymerase sigma-70 factor (ECF subfamily)